MAFYFLRQDLFGSADTFEIAGHTALSARFDWVAGAAFEQPYPNETFVLQGSRGAAWPEFFDTSIPVMSQRLIDALRASGVANVEVYPVTLETSDGGRRTDYSAVNVIGVCDAVDWSASEHQVRRGKPRVTGAVAIDAARVGERAAFRLPCSPRFIVLAARVAERLRELSLPSVLLQPTMDYDGD